MKPFKFSLETVYDYKNQIFDTEKNKLALANKNRDTIKGQLDQAFSDKQNHQIEFQKKQQKGVNGVEISSYKYILDTQNSRIQTLKINLAEAEMLVTKQLAVVTKVSNEVSGYERLEEKQQGRHAVLEKRETEANMLEYVTIAKTKSQL